MLKTGPALIIAIAAIFITVTESYFIVPETHQALVLQFGKPVQTVRTAGLYFKKPFIQQVEFFERRILDVDPPPERVILASTQSGFLASLQQQAPNNDKEKTDKASGNGSPIIVDTFARYRITDPLKFRQHLSSEQAAELRITNEMDSTTRDVLGRSTIEQLLSKDRDDLMLQIKKRVNDAVKGLGIEIVDVRINRADLTENLREASFNRMRSEREQRAAEIRSFGEKRAQEIRSDADKDRTVLLAEAQRQAQILRGQGDQDASRIYASAYQRDPSFYRFYRSLEAYKQTLGRKETSLILSQDSDFFTVLRNNSK